MKNINWKYALGEILLIFIGITLAIAFQNWNENRKLGQIETEVLTQLNEALQNDLVDVNANIKTHQRGVANCESMLRALTSEEAINGDIFLGNFVNSVDFTFLVSDASTYEYLKSVGLHIIQEDTLRRQITNLYGAVYKGIYGIEDNAEPIQQDLVRNFKKYYTSNADRLIPMSNVNDAKKDNPLKFDIRTLQFYHQLMINKYTNSVKPELESLIKNVDASVNR